MRCKKTDLISIYITPKQLKELADRLEAKWKASKLGDNVPHEELDSNHLSGGVIVRFIVDQEDRYEEDRREKKS